MNAKAHFALAAALAVAASLNAGTRIYPEGGSDLWTDAANWTNGVPGVTDTGDVTFNLDSKGKTTLLSGTDTYSIQKLVMAGGNLEISGATLYLNSWFASGVSANPDSYDEINITVSNGGTFNTTSFSMGDKEYTDTNITVKDGSFFVMRTQATIGSRANTNSTITIEKGATWNSQKLLVGNSAGANATVNVYGDHAIGNNMSIGEAGAAGVYNLYGSGSFSAANSMDKRAWVQATGTLAFRLTGVDARRISDVEGGVIAGGVTAMFDLGSALSVSAGGRLLIDFTDFSVEGAYTAGEQYAIALISTTTSNLISAMSVEGLEYMGDDKEWSLAGSDKADYLKYSNGTYYLLVQYNAIPEPSVFAAIFGAAAFVFASCRRRRA